MTQILTLLSVITLSFIDQIVKISVVNKLAPSGKFVIVKDILQFTYVENTGAIFGSLHNKTMGLAVVTLLIILTILALLLTKRIKSKFMYVCLVLVVSGGIGNFIDRMTRGFVVDYIEPLFINFAIFNFADCLVTVGAFSMMGYLVFDLVKDIRRAKHEKL
jgi:signal peptidase II